MPNFKIKHMALGPLETNCYLVHDESNEAVLIDCPDSDESLYNYITENKLMLKYVFLTHGHFDHIMGVKEIKKRFPKTLVAISKIELDVINNMGQVAKMFGFDYEKDFVDPDIFLEDNQIYSIGNKEITTIATPGHSPGSISFRTADSLFCGDVLFQLGIGRTDLYKGNSKQLEKTIKKLYMLSDHTIIYPGHGPLTTIGNEKKNNPFVQVEQNKY